MPVTWFSPTTPRGTLTRRVSSHTRLPSTGMPASRVIVNEPSGRSMTTSSPRAGTAPVLQLAPSLQLPSPTVIQVTASVTTRIPASVMPPSTGSRPTTAPDSTSPPTVAWALTVRSPSSVGTSLNWKKPSASEVVAAPVIEIDTSAFGTEVPSASWTKPSTVVSSSPRETTAVTVAVTPSLVTVMNATPSSTAVTTPAASTLAMAALLEA